MGSPVSLRLLYGDDEMLRLKGYMRVNIEATSGPFELAVFLMIVMLLHLTTRIRRDELDDLRNTGLTRR